MKAQYAQEISSAQLQIQDLQKTVEDALRRAEEAEAYQKSVQAEIAEAKVVQKYNAQLHKDLQREQLARKKLHNDMEDMKGVLFWFWYCAVRCCGRYILYTVGCQPRSFLLRIIFCIY
jgi:nitric oxide reductase large subunit